MHTLPDRPIDSLVVENLFCNRQDKLLYAHFSVQCTPGRVLHIQGANGVGKSSFLAQIAGVLPIETGVITWGNKPFDADSRAQCGICYIAHQSGMHPDLTVRQNLHYYLDTHQSVDPVHIELALESVGLSLQSDELCSVLSAGQLRRLSLARLWLTEARLWLLDEPFNALDVKTVALLKDKITEQSQSGGLVIFTSHQRVDEWSIPVDSVELSFHD